MKKRILALLLLLSLLFTACAAPAQPTAPTGCTAHTDADDNGVCDVCLSYVLVVVDFYNINDLHGKIDDTDKQPGVDELTTYFKRMQKSDEHAILLSTGDMWQGSSESNLTAGNLATDWMNELGFAAMALGNHEFDWGEAPIEGNDAIAQFPFLAINVYDRETDQRVSYCDASTVVEVGGLQIGIIGAIGDCYSSISADKTEGVYFLTGEKLTGLVMAESRKLRSEGVDFIVYILHDGLGESRSTNATNVSNREIASYYDIALSNGYVDLVFEGHTHQQYILKDSYGVYHMQNRGENQGISHAEVMINTVTGTVRMRQANLISADYYGALESDPLVDELLQKYDEQIAISREVLGTNAYIRRSNAIKQLVAKLYYETGMKRWGSDYNIVLGGGFMSVRSPYDLAAGDVTYGQLQMLLPFDNQIVLCSIKGRDLKSKFFETNNSNYYISYGAYGTSVRQNIDPDATYYIVTDTYTSQYASNRLTEIARFDEITFARDLLAEYIKAGGLK